MENAMPEAQLAGSSLDTQALFKRYHVGWVTRNPDLIASLHSSDTIFWLHDEAGPVKGREALRKHCVDLFARLRFGLEEGRMFFGADYWIFEWTMVLDLADTGGKPFTARVEMLDIVTVNEAGEGTRKDVYMNGAQRRDAFSRAG
jgi:hypothetical protein